jgi:hypothetical protein
VGVRGWLSESGGVVESCLGFGYIGEHWIGWTTEWIEGKSREDLELACVVVPGGHTCCGRAGQ